MLSASRDESIELTPGLRVGRLGLGGRSGASSDAVDASLAIVYRAGLSMGHGLFDASPAFRHGRSETVLGSVVAEHLAAGGRRADATVLVKVGRELRQNRTLDAAALTVSLAASLGRLRLTSADVVLIEGPEWVHETNRGKWEEALLDAFRWAEAAREAGQFRTYGLASAVGVFRPPGDPLHLSLERAVALAKQAGGETHGLRVLQCPLNLRTLPAALREVQAISGERVSVLRAAATLGLAIVGTAPLHHGCLPSRVGSEREALSPGTAGWHLQLVRSTPGVHAVIVGTTSQSHLAEVAHVASLPRWSVEEWIDALG